MAKKIKKDLDMETTVADMNVEGFHWYNPRKKDKKKPQIEKVTDKEYRAMVRGAYKAMIPMICCIAAGALLMFLFAFLWLK